MIIIKCSWPFAIARLFVPGLQPFAISMIPLIILVNRNIKVSDDLYQQTIYHEKVHQRQMLFTLWIGFYLTYVLFYLWGLIRHKGNARRAYLKIPWEVQARRLTREKFRK